MGQFLIDGSALYTGWFREERGKAEEHLPLNKIEPAIARWNRLDETNRNMIVPTLLLLTFIYILAWWSRFKVSRWKLIEWERSYSDLSRRDDSNALS